MTKGILLASLVLGLLAQKSLAQEQSFGFGAPAFKIGNINSQTALMFGGIGAYSHHNFYIGGGGFGLMNGEVLEWEVDGNIYKGADLGMGGMMLGYYNKLGPFQYYAQSLMAWGSAEIKDLAEFSFFSLNPELGLVLPFGSWMGLGIGGAYRYIIPTSGSAKFTQGFNGLELNISLRFGWTGDCEKE